MATDFADQPPSVAPDPEVTRLPASRNVRCAPVDPPAVVGDDVGALVGVVVAVPGSCRGVVVPVPRASAWPGAGPAGVGSNVRHPRPANHTSAHACASRPRTMYSPLPES